MIAKTHALERQCSQRPLAASLLAQWNVRDELLQLMSDGRRVRDWQILMIHNPLTQLWCRALVDKILVAVVGRPGLVLRGG